MKKHRKHKKRRTAAQIRATRKMLAAARRARGSSTSSSKPRRRRSRRRRYSNLPPSGVPQMRRKSRRRGRSRGRSRRSRVGGSRRAFLGLPGGVNVATLSAVGVTAGGLLAVNYVITKLGTVKGVPASLTVGYGRIAAKAGAAVITSMVLRKSAPQIARGLLIGGLVSCALDIFNVATAGAGGVSGWNDNGTAPMPQLPASPGMAGDDQLGAFAINASDPAAN